MLRIALPNKGRLSEDARDLFTDAGLEVRGRGERALTASLGGEFEAIFVRAADIPEFVADGAAQAGITGVDLVRESGCDQSRSCSISSSGAAGWLSPHGKTAGSVRSAISTGKPRVATVFPRITAAFFAQAEHSSGHRAGLGRGRDCTAPWHRRHRRRPDLDRFDPEGERPARGRHGARVIGPDDHHRAAGRPERARRSMIWWMPFHPSCGPEAGAT